MADYAHIQRARQHLAAGGTFEHAAQRAGMSPKALFAALSRELHPSMAYALRNVARSEWMHRLKTKLTHDTESLKTAQILAQNWQEGRAMAKAHDLADRLRATKERFNNNLDAVATKLDEFDAKEPGVTAAAHELADGMHTEADDLLAQLAQISNLPLGQKKSETESNG